MINETEKETANRTCGRDGDGVGTTFTCLSPNSASVCGGCTGRGRLPTIHTTQLRNMYIWRTMTNSSRWIVISIYNCRLVSLSTPSPSPEPKSAVSRFVRLHVCLHAADEMKEIWWVTSELCNYDEYDWISLPAPRALVVYTLLSYLNHRWPFATTTRSLLQTKDNNKNTLKIKCKWWCASMTSDKMFASPMQK